MFGHRLTGEWAASCMGIINSYAIVYVIMLNLSLQQNLIMIANNKNLYFMFKTLWCVVADRSIEPDSSSGVSGQQSVGSGPGLDTMCP